MNSQQYEFSATQNKIIHQLAQRMRFVAYVLIGLGILVFVIGLVGLFSGGRGGGGLIQGIIQFIIGFWTNRAAIAFQRIVATEGNDIANLMDALGELKKLYTLQFWLFVVAIIVIAIGLVIALVIGATGGLR